LEWQHHFILNPASISPPPGCSSFMLVMEPIQKIGADLKREMRGGKGQRANEHQL
jgi:hypothetical protein